jgi:hypothetical protein
MSPHGLIAIAATDMEMPEGKQQPPKADLHEAVLWYLRSKAKQLPTEEMHEFVSWLRRSPANASALLRIAEEDRRVVPRRHWMGRFNRALGRVLRRGRADSSESSKHRALSLSYYKHVRRQSLYPKIGLLFVTLSGVSGWMFLDDVRPLKIGAVALACFLLMLVREFVLRLRIEKGYFGGTESEVREFVAFIRACRDDIDFTDEGGKRRPSLVPEPPAPKSGTSAASAPTGAWSE